VQQESSEKDRDLMDTRRSSTFSTHRKIFDDDEYGCFEPLSETNEDSEEYTVRMAYVLDNVATSDVKNVIAVGLKAIIS